MASRENDLVKGIIQKYEDSVKNPKRQTLASREWFRKHLRKNIRSVRQPRIVQGATFHDKPRLGSLYFFAYDAKHKRTLPYYDKFPLVFFFSINPKNGHYFGMNLHYLPPIIRVKLFTQLLKLRNEKRYRKTTRLKLTWTMLQAFSASKFVEPCVKQYIPKQMRSKLIKVDPEYWEIMVSLPTEKWSGASSAKVWADSKKKIAGKK